MSASSTGSATETRTSAWAAKWKTTSGLRRDHQVDQVARADVELVEIEAAGARALASARLASEPGGQVVHDIDGVALRKEPVHQRGPDETCPPGYQCPVASGLRPRLLCRGRGRRGTLVVVPVGTELVVLAAVLELFTVVGDLAGRWSVVVGSGAAVVVVVPPLLSWPFSAFTIAAEGSGMTGVLPFFGAGRKAMVTSWSFSRRTPESQSGSHVSSRPWALGTPAELGTPLAFWSTPFWGSSEGEAQVMT